MSMFSKAHWTSRTSSVEEHCGPGRHMSTRYEPSFLLQTITTMKHDRSSADGRARGIGKRFTTTLPSLIRIAPRPGRPWPGVDRRSARRLPVDLALSDLVAAGLSGLPPLRGV